MSSQNLCWRYIWWVPVTALLQLGNMNLILWQPLRQGFSVTDFRTQMNMQKKTIPWNSLPVLPLEVQQFNTNHLGSQVNNAGYLSCLYYWLVCSIRILTQKELIFRKKKYFPCLCPLFGKEIQKEKSNCVKVSSFHNTTKLQVKKLFIFRNKTTPWLTFAKALM